MEHRSLSRVDPSTLRLRTPRVCTRISLIKIEEVEIGADVTNSQGEDIGEVNEVVLDTGGQAEGLVVDVGGFLGVGERRILVDWSDVTVRGEDDGSVTVATALDKARLESLPEYRIPVVQ